MQTFQADYFAAYHNLKLALEGRARRFDRASRLFILPRTEC
jgi:hypothetical protein